MNQSPDKENENQEVLLTSNIGNIKEICFFIVKNRHQVYFDGPIDYLQINFIETFC